MAKITDMEQGHHPTNMGKLVVNFQSLEFALRAFLVNYEIGSGVSYARSVNPSEMNEGDIVSENAFTNYDTLGQLITKYNAHNKISSAGLTIDVTLVDIRDAIAHGRISSDTPDSIAKLLKFDKPENKAVKVAFSVLMTKEWFGEQIKRVYAAILKVNESNEKLRNGKL